MPLTGPSYPVHLVLTGKRCLVVGGGVVASGKVAGLLRAGASVKVIAPTVGTEVRALGVQFDERAYKPSDLIGIRLVIVATDNPTINKQVHDDAESLGIWVNAADDPANCTFILPSVVRRGAVTLTASTGGHSPALSKWLRGKLEDLFGDEYATLADILSEVRTQARARGHTWEPADWQRALDSDMLELIRAGEVQKAKERLEACLSSPSA